MGPAAGIAGIETTAGTPDREPEDLDADDDESVPPHFNEDGYSSALETEDEEPGEDD